MIWDNLNLGVDDFFVMSFENNMGDKVCMYAIQYDSKEENTRQILDFINKEYVEDYSYDVLLPHNEMICNKGHVLGLNIRFTEEFINNPNVKLCFNETEPFTLKHNDYLMFVIFEDNKLYVSTVVEIEAEFMFNNWIVGEHL